MIIIFRNQVDIRSVTLVCQTIDCFSEAYDEEQVEEWTMTGGIMIDPYQ